MKYMVMECHPAFAVVMDEEGRFSKVANRGYQVGQTVTDVFPMQVPGKKKKPRALLHLLQGAAAVAACAMVVAAVMLYPAPVAYASVYLDMAPQIRIDTDKQAQVVALSADGPEGASLLEGYDYQNKELGQIVRELVERAVQMEYLPAGCNVILRVDAEDTAWAQQQSESLRDELARTAAETDPAELWVDWEDWLDAHEPEDVDDPDDLDDFYDDLDDWTESDQKDTDAADELEDQLEEQLEEKQNLADDADDLDDDLDDALDDDHEEDDGDDLDDNDADDWDDWDD